MTGMLAVRFTPTCVGTTSAAARRCSSSAVHPHVRGDDTRPRSTVSTGVGSPPRAWGRRGVSGAQRTSPTVHPHVRGDDEQGAYQVEVRGGSPPRAWGRLRLGEHVPPRRRFTPTCVGTTTGCSGSGRRSSVHPHVRGDDEQHLGHAGDAGGSPPRAWGRRFVQRQPILITRFTPTCVGTTMKPSRSLTVSIGSPPRAWGRHDPAGTLHHEDRFTPRCVGTTRRGSPRRHRRSVHPHVRGDDEAGPVKRRPATVHPHVRGDDLLGARDLARVRGSPPRAWGRPLPSGARYFVVRFTPTCVGTTLLRRPKPWLRPVHPHVRGDDFSVYASASAVSGSPPRAWGRRIRRGPSHFLIGSPPRAWGRRVSMPRASASSTVHPHVRGDDGQEVTVDGGAGGSPPRAWGRLDDPELRRAISRFTPTCVGTTNSDRHGWCCVSVHPHVRGDDADPCTAVLARWRFTPTCVGTTAGGSEGLG